MNYSRLHSVLSAFVAGSLLSLAIESPTRAESADQRATNKDPVHPIAIASKVRNGSPNIVVVLLDDVGFAADSPFGGPVPTPNLEKLAEGGLRYNRFHTTAMCSPTRAALLTGRNHHRVEMGSIVNLAFAADGYSSVIPDSAATIADVLKANGYATAWFGKNHVTPLWEQTAAGPFDRWPNGLGFDYFYGFMDGASDQFNPILIENRNPIDPNPDGNPDYILDKDLINRAINWLDRVKDAAPDKPVFVYMAPGSAHEPHQAPAEWVAKFRGAFDHGYDEERNRIFQRQQQLEVIPAHAVLTPRPEILPAWASLTEEQKRVAARQMEAFAAQRAYFDYEFGQMVDAFKARGEWENTLVIFIDGDNGSSGEGGLTGTTLGLLNRPAESEAYKAAKLETYGGPSYRGNYSAAWGWALNAPFPWLKQHASHLGGLRAGMIVSWPAKITPDGKWRSQYSHVNDIAPTIYDAVGIKPEPVIAGVKQLPIDGISLAYSFAKPDAPSRRRVQYYEMLGNVGIYKDGWFANLSPPNLMFAPGYGENKKWELYNLDIDFSQSRDLAGLNPAKLSELKSEWAKQQRDNGFVWQNVSIAMRGNPANRPDLLSGKRSFAFKASSAPIPDGEFPDVFDRQWSLTVEVDLLSESEEGTLISQGGYPFGWGLYMLEGVPTFLYLNEPQHPIKLTADRLSAGRHVIEIGMVPTGKGPGGPATMHLVINGEPKQLVSVARTVPASFGANGVGIGREVGTVMLPQMEKPFAFTGRMGPLVLKIE